MGKDKEHIKMTQSLSPKEQIESWLLDLENIMKDSLKRECKTAAKAVLNENLLENDLNHFLKTPSQCALMGLQM